MALISNKTKKAIAKDMRKLVRKHGSELAVGLASSLLTNIATRATDDKSKKGKKKSKGKKH